MLPHLTPAGPSSLRFDVLRRLRRLVEPKGSHLAPSPDHKKSRLAGSFLYDVAEREGFEPSIGFKAYTPLAGERLQPLGHLSGNLEAGF